MLGYNVGDMTDVEDALALDLLDQGIAEKAISKPVETAEKADSKPAGKAENTGSKEVQKAEKR